MKSKRNRISYIQTFCNCLINFCFIIILMLIGLFFYKSIFFVLRHIPNIDSIYGNIISAFVTVLLAIISYITKIKKILTTLLQKIKQKIYQFLSFKFNPLSPFTITDFNADRFTETKEQGKIVSSAIHILKNNIQNTILVSGYAGRGKTTSIMLLLSAIAKDRELYQLFSQLQNRIIYFDSVNDKKELLEYLQNSKKHIYKLIIVDNIQKYTNSSINEIMDKIENLDDYNKNINQKILIILLFQESPKNYDLIQYIKSTFFIDNGLFFELNKYINYETKSHKKNYSFEDNKLITYINEIDDNIFKQHIKYILNNKKNKSIIKFLNNIVFTNTKSEYTEYNKKFFLLNAFILLGNINGYVTKKDLHFLWKRNYSLISIPQEDFLISYYVHNHVLAPFPFLKSSFIFNEQIAKEYRKRLKKNKCFIQNSYIIAENMFLSCNEHLPQKWIFFLFCSPDYCITFSQEKRMSYFENALSSYHLQYILDLLETEISLMSNKEEIFRPELGIIYIYNGEWEKAKQILYPYLQSHDEKADIWSLQLKIIETEHEGYDTTYLQMLTYMENNCTDPTILFQVKYWQEHIYMEHGIFNLDNWNEMASNILHTNDLRRILEDEHFSTRVVSDLERCYYLKGNINYFQYSSIIDKYLEISNKINRNDEPLEYTLSSAYYIQYDILFQLGIWGYIKYGEINPDIIPAVELSDNNTIVNDFIYSAMEIYDYCIQKYQSEGKKKYRTLKVRRSELTLCINSNNYIEALNQYEQFEKYAIKNGIKLFEGYCNTQKGKAFGLYAYYMLIQNDFDKYEEYLIKAVECLKHSQKIYEKWGNSYGVFRASLLLILIHMIQDKDFTKSEHMNPNEYREKYTNLLINLDKMYNSRNQYVREHNVIEYVQQNILRLDIPLRVLKYYPIILQ